MAKKTIAGWIIAFGGWIVQNFPSVQTGGIIKLRDFYNANNDFKAWFDEKMIEDEFNTAEADQILETLVENLTDPGLGV